MAEAGATAFRLNASHLDADRLAAALADLGRACPGAPVVVDLQGAKMRVALPAPRDVAAGARVTLAPRGEADLVVPHAELFAQARRGDTLSLDDGRILLEVVAATAGGIEARVACGGHLLPNKGINVVQHPVRLDRLTARDAAACEAAARHDAGALAFSFMLDGTEAAWLRALSPRSLVVGKIERADALPQLDALARRVDAAWICRGDLGVQLGPAGLARFVAGFDPARLPVPVLMAGQVLEHLVRHAEPTRSEVCHLFDLAARGYAGIVLSDETAIGDDPVRAVSTAAALLDAFRR